MFNNCGGIQRNLNKSSDFDSVVGTFVGSLAVIHKLVIQTYNRTNKLYILGRESFIKFSVSIVLYECFDLLTISAFELSMKMNIIRQLPGGERLKYRPVLSFGLMFFLLFFFSVAWSLSQFIFHHTDMKATVVTAGELRGYPVASYDTRASPHSFNMIQPRMNSRSAWFVSS